MKEKLKMSCGVWICEGDCFFAIKKEDKYKGQDRQIWTIVNASKQNIAEFDTYEYEIFPTHILACEYRGDFLQDTVYCIVYEESTSYIATTYEAVNFRKIEELEIKNITLNEAKEYFEKKGLKNNYPAKHVESNNIGLIESELVIKERGVLALFNGKWIDAILLSPLEFDLSNKTLRRLYEEKGFSIGEFYHHFGGKEQIVTFTKVGDSIRLNGLDDISTCIPRKLNYPEKFEDIKILSGYHVGKHEIFKTEFYNSSYNNLVFHCEELAEHVLTLSKISMLYQSFKEYYEQEYDWELKTYNFKFADFYFYFPTDQLTNEFVKILKNSNFL